MAEKYKQNLIAQFQKEIEERKQSQSVALKDGVIDVVGVDLNIRSNAKLHHTDEYEQTLSSPKKLIIRRGSPFLVKVIFDRTFDPKKDELAIEFTYGPKPSMTQKTYIFLEVQPENYEMKTKQWGAKLGELSSRNLGNEVLVEVNASIQAPIGEWRMKLHTGFKIDGNLETYLAYTNPDFVFILFNPWCPDDQVFMENEQLLKEYVLNEVGVASWVNKSSHYVPDAKWIFGQFEDVSLYAALVGLRTHDDGYGPSNNYFDASDPLKVAVQLGDLVMRVIEGEWCMDGRTESECYAGGTHPTEWVGSVAILEEFMKTQKAVKYAQCWVYGGLLCTLLRAVGIPSRCVTNIGSALDSNGSLTIDTVYIKPPGCEPPVREQDLETKWNFHVWNELWSNRPDLNGYDGWQAVDAQGMGPCPVHAIRKGDINVQKHTFAFYGVINSDQVLWLKEKDPTAPFHEKVLACKIVDTAIIGKAIITSYPGNHNTAKLITGNYKAEEGTEEERKQHLHAIRKLKNRDYIKDILRLYGLDKRPLIEDVEFKFEAQPYQIDFGENARTVLVVRLRGKEKRTINYTVKKSINSNTGTTVHDLGDVSKCAQQFNPGHHDSTYVRSTHTQIELPYFPIIIAPHRKLVAYFSASKVIIEAESKDYELKMGPAKHIRFECVAWVDETWQLFRVIAAVYVELPPLTLSVVKNGNDTGDEDKNTVYLNMPVHIQVQFTNPMSHTLANVSVKIEGNGITKSQGIDKTPKTIKGGKTMIATYMVTPKKMGVHTLIATFNSDQIGNIQGSLDIKVMKGNTYL